jgi:hypothetical protein
MGFITLELKFLCGPSVVGYRDMRHNNHCTEEDFSGRAIPKGSGGERSIIYFFRPNRLECDENGCIRNVIPASFGF